MLNLQKRRVQLALFVAGLIALSMTAEKFREFVGEEASSKSGKFTIFNCFDMGSGTLSCGIKEGVKLYVYNIRSAHVEKVRQRATEMALAEALKEGLSNSEKQSIKAGTKAAKLATRQAKRILGPILSSGWDFFEAIYYGGSMTEGFLRGVGTLFGTYVGGFHGEQRLGKLGYLGGSHFGSWIGGRIGLMIYDVVNGVQYLLNFPQSEDSPQEINTYKRVEDSESYDYTTPSSKSTESYEFATPLSDESIDYESRIEDSDNTESSGGWGFF
ncbi:uncharacterized protein LOC109822345 [Asparagus officinalis]|uniref:uncharacterized protein LOC109822345 n=1 Tax=Asparagus officinalis TaxID=4686 RepID=UPI00098E4666|nr:uncharacterized protein LOC109822345 [Asparagus officinalis]